MPILSIINSPNISILGYMAHFNLSSGQLIVDLSPSVWKAGGENNVVGASLIVISPSGKVLSNGASNVFLPPMNTQETLNLPLFNSVYEWGVYQFRVTLDEGGGVTQVINGTFDLCAPESNDKNTGTLCIEANPDCDDGVLRLYGGSVRYKGFAPTTWFNDLTFYYPQTAKADPVAIPALPIELDLISGTNLLEGNSTGYFDVGDNYYVTAVYTTKEEIYVACAFPCYLWCPYTDLLAKVASCVSDVDLQEKMTKVDRYMTLILFGHKCGQDISAYVKILEELLECQGACAPTVIGTSAKTPCPGVTSIDATFN